MSLDCCSETHPVFELSPHLLEVSLDEQRILGAEGLEVLGPRVDQLETCQLHHDPFEVDPQAVVLVDVELAHVLVGGGALRVHLNLPQLGRGPGAGPASPGTPVAPHLGRGQPGPVVAAKVAKVGVVVKSCSERTTHAAACRLSWVLEVTL